MAYQKLARRFKFLIASYERHGLGHVIEVFRQERVRRSYARSPIPLPTADAMMRAFPWFREESSFLDDFHRSASRRLPFTRANRKEFFINLLLSLQSYDEIIDDADAISEGRFEGLGICIREPDGRFDWHRDYSSGRVWPRAPYHAVNFMQGDGSDVKYVWELNRMYWIAWLGKAYWTTNNGVWAREYMRLVDEWREANPINTGVNWSMPMEVAIRGYWLMAGYAFFQGAPNIPREWWIDYLRLAWGHGSYLERNLEYFSNLTNHYISNCFGLVALGSLFAESAEGDRWLREGRARMIAELEHQVLDDGVHYERSICYHRLVTEMYLIALVLAERAGAPFPGEARKKIEKMAEFMRDYIPPKGTVPQFGDSDDGVILRMRLDQELYDHRDTMALAASIFGREDFMRAAGGYSQAALFTIGSAGFETMRGKDSGAPATSRLYEHGGFAILRSDMLHVVADVGEIGLHGNNDTLAFTLHDSEGALLIDPGTYCYTRSERLRNELRATGAHDTPEIDGREIAEFDGLWRIREDRTRVKIIEWRAGAEETILEAEHHAYEAPASGGVVIRRRWELRRGELRVRDRIDGSGPHRVKVRFTVPAGLSVERIDETIVEIGSTGRRLRFECSLPVAVRAGWYSPSYGVAAQGTYFEIASEANAPSEMAYIYRSLSNP